MLRRTQLQSYPSMSLQFTSTISLPTETATPSTSSTPARSASTDWLRHRQLTATSSPNVQRRCDNRRSTVKQSHPARSCSARRPPVDLTSSTSSTGKSTQHRCVMTRLKSISRLPVSTSATLWWPR
ncbi:hypothetical protein MPH_13264 [Macrophomina phaseolina MS6]|uniref:Uncharacterized protein n=1 Tax=Macrophomina phaseolina (strain MS6) TaxID=1126212 RepID=K2RHS4_MACPH|nr:hypothetical protein MPH_13264 [Macrophomina phaseolina MS6]